MTESSVASFYDEFSTRLIRDYVHGNRRVDAQLAFSIGAIPPAARRILIVGSGCGYEARRMAQRASADSTILAIDISSTNIARARQLQPHPRVEHRQADILADTIEPPWDVILLPDVYEHIPTEDRPTLHKVLHRLLADRGSLVLTLPSPRLQAYLKEQGQGLQVVDETVTHTDLAALAGDVGGVMTYFKLVSVWSVNDYMHVIIEREPDGFDPACAQTEAPIRHWRSDTWERRLWNALLSRSGIRRLQRWQRRRQVARRLGPAPEVMDPPGD